MDYPPPPPSPPAEIRQVVGAGDPWGSRFAESFLLSVKRDTDILEGWLGHSVNYTPSSFPDLRYDVSHLAHPRPRLSPAEKRRIDAEVESIAADIYVSYHKAPESKPDIVIELIKGTAQVLSALGSGLVAALYTNRKGSLKAAVQQPTFLGGQVLTVLTSDGSRVYSPSGRIVSNLAIPAPAAAEVGHYLQTQGQAGWVWLPVQGDQGVRTDSQDPETKVIWLRSSPGTAKPR